jgi:excisionase family DNA binding protein
MDSTIRAIPQQPDTSEFLPDLPEFLTPREVSECLRIAQSTAYRLLSDGTIPSAKIGGTIRIHRDDLRAVTASRRKNQPQRRK